MKTSANAALGPAVQKKSFQNRHAVAANLRRYWDLYLLMLPGILYFVIFKYIPIAGLSIAFQNYSIFAGFSGSDWVGLEHFRTLFADQHFFIVLRNTLLISFYKIIFGFPGPIVLALLLNEIKVMFFKRTVQTLAYLPHFLSWVILGGIVTNILSPSTGFVNGIITFFGFEPIFFLANPSWFRSVLVASDIWKEVGWGAIVYLAALSSIDPQLYEAAVMDGAGKWKQLRHITLPSITGTIIIMFLLRLGHVLEVGFEQIYILYNSLVYDVADVFETYVYREGIVRAHFSYTTAVGMFKSVVSLLFVVTANRLVKRFGHEGIY